MELSIGTTFAIANWPFWLLYGINIIYFFGLCYSLFHSYYYWLMILMSAVIGETLTFVAPQGLTFLSNGEW